MLLTAALATGGCGTLPESPTGLVETATHVRDYCYQLPREEVRTRVEQLLVDCYGAIGPAIPAGASTMPSQGDDRVLNRILWNGNRYSVKGTDGVIFSVDVLAGDEYCETRVHIYAVTGYRDRTVTALNRAVNRQEAACP